MVTPQAEAAETTLQRTTAKAGKGAVVETDTTKSTDTRARRFHKVTASSRRSTQAAT